MIVIRCDVCQKEYDPNKFDLKIYKNVRLIYESNNEKKDFQVGISADLCDSCIAKINFPPREK